MRSVAEGTGPTEETHLSASPLRLAACAGAVAVLLIPVPAYAARSAPEKVSVTAAEKLQPRVVTRKIPRLTRRQLALRHARARVRVVRFARAQRGDWYAYGGAGPSTWDCSGLTRGTYRVVGIRLPHSSAAQARRGKRVTPRTARVGDLVAMRGHVGILVGRWRMVDAPGTGRRVTERLIFRTRTLQFRRLIG
ncbi:C40 family peptidase [Actinoplanes sp. NPDC049681]|uniref:C40 family peptidase n=1 Tax=Actinoplanes sp. NPDC049681 TaxID=3363905 RepID=UPI00379C0F04